MPTATLWQPGGSQKPTTVAHTIVERIMQTYPRQQAQHEGISYWPDPLPTPVPTLMPDPLVLFKPAASIPVMPPGVSRAPAEEQRERLSVLSSTLHEAVQSRQKNKPDDPPMRIPLGLVDLPDSQKRDVLWIDLHGTAGSLSGGPLLVAGAQNSGKATALQTAMLWLMARYSPRQLRVAVIDPNRDLDFLQDAPYVRDEDGSLLWTDGDNEEHIVNVVNRFTQMIANRRQRYANLRWDENTIGQLRSQGTEMPLLLLILSHYHTFAENFKLNETLKKLVLSIVGVRTMGIYAILTSAEVGRFIPPDLMGKMGTRIGLFLNEQQRYDLFGRGAPALDTIPGRGFTLNRDRSMYEIQLALPVPGSSESQRYETLKREALWLAGQ